MQRSLIAPALIFSLSAVSCDSAGTPEPTPLTRTYELSTGWGTRSSLAIDPEKNFTLDIRDSSITPVKSYRFTGTCAEPTAAFSVETCVVATSEEATQFPVGTELKFKEIPGVMMIMGFRKPTDPLPAAPAETLPTAAFLWEVSTICDPLQDDYGSLDVNAVHFGVSRMNLQNASFRHSDFNLKGSGTTFATLYTTPVAGGGQDNITSSRCENGLWTMSVQPASGGPAAEQYGFATPAGLVLANGMAHVPSGLAISNLDEIASTQLEGAVIQFASAGPSVDPFKLGLGIRAANLVHASTYQSASGVPTLQGLSIMLGSDPSLGARLTAPTDPTNALASSYQTAAKTPGLLYSRQIDGGGYEIPSLMLGFRSKTDGKLVLLGVTTTRIGDDYGLSTLFLATEQW